MATIVEPAGLLVDDQRRPRRVSVQSAEKAALLLALLVVIGGVVARFYAPTALWLDESLSVNIAKLPLTQIPAALSHDGSPPLYYVILHCWMLIFGQGDFAVRALSGLASLGALPLMWAAGKRIGGSSTAIVALLLGASSPFAIYYATDTRMYAQMILLSVAGFLALARALESPTKGRLVALGALTAAMLYTHYWGLYLVGVTGLWLLYHLWREARGVGTAPGSVPGAARRVLFAVLLGSALFLPWAPVFIFQALHTGTPWTSAPGLGDMLAVFGQFAGSGPWGLLLTFLLFALALLGVFGRPGPRPGSVLLEASIRPRARPLAFVVFGTLFTAVVLGAVANAAFVARYTAVVFPLFIVLSALGLTTFGSKRVVAGMVGVASLAGVLTGFGNNASPRTQAVQVAAVLNVQARPGDVVLYCPDQLGPAVDRLLRVPGISEVTFPRMIGPSRVDWVDYKKTIDRTDVGAFAKQLLANLPSGNALWMVWRDGYPGFGGDCGYLESWLQMLHPGAQTVVRANGSYYEYENLVRFTN